jgi:effector-binding domain-containing protein
MKILKYLLLLAILVFITTIIFVATLKPDFNIVKSQIINAPTNVVYNYVNNLKNWQEIGFCETENDKILYRFNKNFKDKNSSFSWNGKEENGSISTISTTENQKIVQKMELNGEKSNFLWTFKDTLGKTKVTWQTKGVLNFETKMLSKFSGGLDDNMGKKIQKSLENINNNLDFEINNFNINIIGYLQKSSCFYLHKTINSKNEKVRKNIPIMISQMIDFFKKNNIIPIGSPFALFNSKDEINQTTNFSVCIATINEQKPYPNANVFSGNLNPFQSVKTTLSGDYSHLEQAKQKTILYFAKNNLIEDNTKPYLEIYIKSKKDVKNPSKWFTEIYIPAKLKKQYFAPKKQQDSSSISVKAPEKLEEAGSITP